MNTSLSQPIIIDLIPKNISWIGMFLLILISTFFIVFVIRSLNKEAQKINGGKDGRKKA
jgi:hypothetical protein